MKEKGLAGYLHKGEQVRWHGTSKEFPLLAKDTKTQIIVKWIAAVVLALVVMILLALWRRHRRKKASEPTARVRDKVKH